MMLLNPRTNANDIAKHKKTRNEVPKHENEDK
jgi:hypothetical protein